jgi:hypothetical protein
MAAMTRQKMWRPFARCTIGKRTLERRGQKSPASCETFGAAPFHRIGRLKEALDRTDFGELERRHAA